MNEARAPRLCQPTEEIPKANLGSLVRVRTGKLDANAAAPNGQYPFFTCAKHSLKIDSFSFDCDCVLLAGNGDFHVQRYKGKFDAYQRTYVIESVDEERLDVDYLFYFLSYYSAALKALSTGGVIRFIKLGDIKDALIPQPPIEHQRRLVDLLSRAENIVRMRREAEQKAKEIVPALFIDMFAGGIDSRNKGNEGLRETVRIVRLGNVVRNLDSARKPVKASERAGMSGSIPYYGASGVIDYVNGFTHEESTLLVAEDGANLVSRSTPIAFQATGRYWVNNHAHVLGETQYADLTFLECLLNMRDLGDCITGSAQPKLTQAALMNLEISLPPMARQKWFADRVGDVRAMLKLQSEALARAVLTFESLLAGVFSEVRTP